MHMFLKYLNNYMNEVLGKKFLVIKLFGNKNFIGRKL